MNRSSHIVIIGWETRRSRRHKKALGWCKDYGFEPLIGCVHIGSVSAREKRELREKLAGLFVSKTEKFFCATLCTSCFSASAPALNLTKEINRLPSFELIQFPENG